MPKRKRQSQPSSGAFLKFKDGNTFDLTILGDQATQKKTHWVGSRSILCGGEGCVFCKAGDQPSLRWQLDVDGPNGIQVWEVANPTFAVVEDVAESVGFLNGLRLRVKRNGTGTDTRYLVLPLDEQPGAPADNDDPETMAAEIKRLCETIHRDPKDELVTFVTQISPAHHDLPAADQLHGLLTWLRQRARADEIEQPTEAAPSEGAASYL